MAEMVRAEAVAQAIGRDTAFRSAIEAAPTMDAKQGILAAHGFGDVSVDDMRAYAESKGVRLPTPGAGSELSEAELAAVAGGLSEGDTYWVSAAVAV